MTMPRLSPCGKNITRFAQCVLERLAVVGAGAKGGDLLLALGRREPVRSACCRSAVVKASFGELRLLLAVALGMFAGDMLMPEFQLQGGARPLMGGVIVAVLDHAHRLDIRALPDDMGVRPAVAVMEDDGAGLVLKPQFFRQHVGGAQPLLRRHDVGVCSAGADVGVIEGLVAAGSLADGLPVAEGLDQVRGGGLYFEDGDAFTRVRCMHPEQVVRELLGPGTGPALDDQGVGSWAVSPTALPARRWLPHTVVIMQGLAQLRHLRVGRLRRH